MTRLRTLFLAPASTLLVVLVLCPTIVVCLYSLLTRGAYGGLGPPWTAESYLRLFDPLYLKLLARSLWLAVVSTGLCLLLGFPLALFISRAGRRKQVFLLLVILPFWTSLLVRIYAWMFLLRDTGLINTLLMSLGLTSEPLPLLYNDGAVILGLVYGHLPFTVLPIYAALERLDRSVIEASADLGARPLSTLWRVILPMSMPGIQAGGLLVFIPCLGAYLIPDLMGGGKSIMIGNLIQNQFTTARDWPFGAAVSLLLMALVLPLALLMLRGKPGRLA